MPDLSGIPPRWILCCNCGSILPWQTWSFWQSQDDWPDEATFEERWRPSEFGECDPMMLCPVCKHGHQDNYGPGIYEGWFTEMWAEREAQRPDYQDLWDEERAVLWTPSALEEVVGSEGSGS